MASAEDFRRIALSFAGTSEAPHFVRQAFKARITFATLGPDGLTANVKLLPDEQALKCLVAAEAFSAIPNGWGRMGWTTATLSALTVAELEDVLRIAWQHASQKPAKTSRKR